MLKTTPEGRLLIAGILNNQLTEITSFTVRLFQSSTLTPADGTLSAAYIAAEATFDGYAAVALSATNWATPTDDGVTTTTTDGQALFQTSPTIKTTNNIYGYFISPTSNLSIVLWGELTSAPPIPMNAPNLGIIVFPRWTVKNQ